MGRGLKHRKALVLISTIVVLLVVSVTQLLSQKPPLHNASAVETAPNIGVYWDKSCTQRVNSVSWGVLAPGETKQVPVYVHNEGNDTTILVLTPLNWKPTNAPTCLSFSWNGPNTTIETNETVKVTLTLHVASPCPSGFSDFSFDIAFEGTTHLLGDVNEDGTVNILDITIVAMAWAAAPGDPRWNPEADLNNDGVINILDLVLVAENFH